MTLLKAQAIICSVQAHGEHGAIVRFLTRDNGLVSGYIRGGRSRHMRPILIAGNLVAAEVRSKSESQLASATAELIESRAPLLDEPLPAAGIEWTTALCAATLPEALPVPLLYDALCGLLDAIAASPGARGWAGAVARFELMLLGELGFGLSLDECVATGARDDLVFVSPKTGGAVSRAAASGFEDRLLALPQFLQDGGQADMSESLTALRLTGHFVERQLLRGRKDSLGDARNRLIDRLERAVA